MTAPDYFNHIMGFPVQLSLFNDAPLIDRYGWAICEASSRIDQDAGQLAVAAMTAIEGDSAFWGPEGRGEALGRVLLGLTYNTDGIPDEIWSAVSQHRLAKI